MTRFLLVGLAWAAVMIGITVLSTRWQNEPPKNRPIQSLTAEYASSDSCRSCHPGNYASWHASYHRTMTQVATPENCAANMDGLELNYAKVDYRVERTGKAYYVRSKPQGAAATAWGKPEEIVLLTGSHTLQVFWLETGEQRTLGQFPFAYIVAEKKWAPMVQTFLVPPNPTQVYARGDWNSGCINCHVTQGRARFAGGAKYDSQVSEFGIACEACHSGGREHIARNRNPLRRFALHLSGGPDRTIANPARMDGPAASLACGQCHSIWTFNSPADYATWSREGGKYRPGNTELDLRWVVQSHGDDHPRQREQLLESSPHFFGDSYWGDGMVRVTGRELNGTIASPCYKGGHFSCLSCHELHPDKTDAASLQTWLTDRQMKPGLIESDQACLQCHAGVKAGLTAHTHHAPGSSGSSCYNCHMPHTTYGLLHAIRSHQVSSPTVRESTELGRPNACNLCHLDQPLAWTAGKMAEWYGQKAPELSPDDRELAAGVRWLLQGDAGQRQLVAWSMGWTPAQQASGRDWLYPYLIFELNDPYAAVRFGAWKSLQSLPGFSGSEFDYTADDAKQKEALAQAYQKWWFGVREPGRYRPQTALEPTGLFRQEVFDRLLNQRNNRPVFLVE
jgi:hypothetical protein